MCTRLKLGLAASVTALSLLPLSLLPMASASAEEVFVPRPLLAGAEIYEPGRALATEDGKLAVKEGSDVVVETITIEPGGSLGWHQRPAALFLVTQGTVEHFSSCAASATWEAGNSYLELDGQQRSLIANDADSVAELTAIFPAVAAGATTFATTKAPKGCSKTANDATVTQAWRGASAESGVYDIGSGLNVVLGVLTMEPGFSSGWHTHSEALIIQAKGTLVNYRDCTTRETYEEGVAYTHLPSANHGHHGYLTRNESGEQAQTFAVWFNVPDDIAHPDGLAPFTPLQPTPSECPTMIF